MGRCRRWAAAVVPALEEYPGGAQYSLGPL